MVVKIVRIVTGLLNVNTYIVVDIDSGKTIVIDPGGDEDMILSKIEELDAQVVGIVATHLHFDHVAGVKTLLDELNTDFMYCPLEELIDIKTHYWLARLLGYKELEIPKATVYLNDGDKIELGKTVISVMLTPGHTPGSITLLVNDRAFVGDLIFREGVGRTDFPGGDWDQLVKSVKEKIYTLPDATVLHPGHGPDTTVGYEKKNNPFIRV